jgi:hypothetical protein
MLHSRIDYPKDDERSPATAKRVTPERDTSQGGRVIAMPKRA